MRMLYTFGMYFLGMSSFVSAQTAYVMPDKWYEDIVYANDNDTRIPLETKFNVTYNQNAVVIRIHMKDPHATDLQSLPKGTDGTWPKSDSIEIFLDPGRSCANYQQIAIGADGGRWDKRWLKKVKTSWKSRVSIKNNGWNVEIELPCTDPGMIKPQLGDIWGFNICRNVKNPKNGNYFSTWAHVGAVFNRPDKFGKLIFGNPGAAKKAMEAKIRKELDDFTCELKQKGLYRHFAIQLKKECTETDIRDMKDELLVLEKLKGF